MGATHLSGLAIKPATISAAAKSVTEWDHSGKTIALNLAATQTITLPAATGSGALFPFFVGITATGDKIIEVANATDVMAGSVIVDGTTSTMFQTAATSDTITMNGTTTGGILGSQVTLQDVAAGIWRVTGVLNGSGTEATPFSAAVS